MEREDLGRRRPRFVWFGAVVGGLVVLVGLFALVLVLNNRPPSRLRLPPHVVPKDNGWDDFVRAADAVAAAKHHSPLSDPNGPDKWTMPDYESFMKDNAAAFEMIQEGLRKPCACPSVRDTASLSNTFSRFARLRECARSLAGAAMYYEKKGDYARAVDYQLDCVEMGVSVPNRGVLIADLVGIAIVAIGTSKIEDDLLKLNDAELARVAERMERIQSKKIPFSAVILQDSYCSAGEFADMFARPSVRKGAVNPLKWAEIGGQLSVLRDSSVAEDFSDGAKLVLSNKNALIDEFRGYMKSVAAEAEKPYVGESKVPIPSNPLCQLVAHTVDTGRVVHIHSETTITLIQAEIAVRRYKIENGVYPKSLADLAPKYLKKVPVDPFGGKPLCYRPINAGKSFVLYSIGQNLMDDGGRRPATPYDRTTGDVLLGKP